MIEELMKNNDKKITGCGIFFPFVLMLNGGNQGSRAMGLKRYVY